MPRHSDPADVSVRTVRPADAAAVVRLGRLVDPTTLATPKAFRALLATAKPPGTERLVAMSAGVLVAWAPSGLYESGSGWFWVGVLPEERGRGIGRSLYERIEARLRGAGARSLETTPNDEDGRVFLRRRGFTVATTMRVSELDPRTAPPPPEPPAGVEVVPLRDGSVDIDRLFDLYSQGRADVPSITPRPTWSPAEWRAGTIDHPLLDLDASVVVLEQSEPVSLAWLYTDREGRRGEMLMTATRRDRRGRGLATLAKLAATERAAKLGITRILTSNDTDNASMLAVNRKLGFRPTVVVDSYAKKLEAAPASATRACR